jgi:hypothetical protein
MVQHAVALAIMVTGALVQGWRATKPAQERPYWQTSLGFFLLVLGGAVFNARW